MSKIFYDHLIALEEVEIIIKETAGSLEEREELWHIVDEMVHHKVFESILDRLPGEYHTEFLEKFKQTPNDSNLISFLNECIGEDVEEIIRESLDGLSKEILKEIKAKR